MLFALCGTLKAILQGSKQATCSTFAEMAAQTGNV